jgi:hypothetical protein
MFGFRIERTTEGKNAPQKAKKKHGTGFWVVWIFTFAIEFMLGLNAAFLVDQSVSIVVRNMLAGTGVDGVAPIITLIAALAVGFCFVFGGMWTFADFMDSLEDARAYCKYYGTNKWPVVMVCLLFVAVILLDLSTLLFRSAYFAEKGALALLAFFVILIALPPILGPLIHVLEHTPRDRRLAKARQFAESIESDHIDMVVQEMDHDLRTRWLGGDATALDEHYQRLDDIREDNRLYEQSQVSKRDDTQQHANRPLPMPDTAPRPLPRAVR